MDLEGGEKKMNVWEGIYGFTTKLVQLIYLNFLWLLFTMLGLVFFGLFPATIALFTVLRKIATTDQVSIFPLFLATYRAEFKKVIGYALLTYTIIFILAIDFYAVYNIGGVLQLTVFPLLIVLYLVTSTLVLFFPVYVHFDLTYWQYMKQAFLIGIVSPFTVLLLLLYLIVLYVLFNVLPGAIPLFAASLFAYLCMKQALKTFNKIEKKKLGEVVT